MSIQTNLTPMVSKMYCSPSKVVLMVRMRPHVVNGGGFVVSNCRQEVLFKVDGCGILGSKGEMILRDGDGVSLLYIRRKGGMVQALSVQRKWKGYSIEYDGAEKLVFSIKDPTSLFVRNHPIKVSTEPKSCKKDWDFEIKGSFFEKACTINDRRGNVVAQVGVKEEVEELMVNKDLYHVVVQPGVDQAFVFGIIAVLDYIHGESTTC